MLSGRFVVLTSVIRLLLFFYVSGRSGVGLSAAGVVDFLPDWFRPARACRRSDAVGPKAHAYCIREDQLCGPTSTPAGALFWDAVQ